MKVAKILDFRVPLYHDTVRERLLVIGAKGLCPQSQSIGPVYQIGSINLGLAAPEPLCQISTCIKSRAYAPDANLPQGKVEPPNRRNAEKITAHGARRVQPARASALLANAKEGFVMPHAQNHDAQIRKADFRVTFHGTITLLHPLSDRCLKWLDENVATEDWQWFGNPVAGGGLAVEPRYLDTLVRELAEAGFIVEEE